jgi:uncharacterized protein with FMN-binding domain
MRRAPIVMSATAAGLVGVLSYHVHNSSFTNLSSGGSPAGRAARASRRHHPERSPAAHGSGAAPAAASGSAGASPALERQATGSTVPYGYGQLSVRVSLLGGKITQVQVVGLQTAEQYSQSLAEQVIPTLRSEVLQAQSANVNAVSGATYTSEAFASSLQSALHQLGA